MVVQTTVGRVVFNDILHRKMPFYNLTLGQKQLQGIIADCYQILGRRETIALLDRMKDLGFRESTRSGLSFATDDLKTPLTKDHDHRRGREGGRQAATSSTSAGSSPTRSGTTRCSTPGRTPASGSPPR